MVVYSLFIGINEYADKKIGSLQYAVADAESMHKYFTKEIENTRDGLFDESIIKKKNQYILLNENATRQNILTAIHIIAEHCTDEDTVLFYYAGHGCSVRYKKLNKTKSDSRFTDDGFDKYIVPHDANVLDLVSTAIDFDALFVSLKKIESSKMVVIFDCCHSGNSDGRTFMAPSDIRDGPHNISNNYINALAESGTGRVVMAACGGSEVAFENSIYKHGIFTKNLLDGLSGEADMTKSGFINEMELYAFARAKTHAETGGEQNPVRSGVVSGKPLFLAAVGKRVLEFDKLNESDKDEITCQIAFKFQKYGISNIKIASDSSNSSIGKVASEYLENIITHNHGIALSCGKTLISTITQLRQLERNKIEIFPLNGFSDDKVKRTDSMVLTYLLWNKFESDSTIAHIVPTGIDIDEYPEIKDSIVVSVAKMLQEAKKKTKIYLFGIGVPDPFNKNIKSLAEAAKQPIKFFEDMGAVGEINFHLYDRSGNFLVEKADLDEVTREAVTKYNSKFISFSPFDLKEVSNTPAEIVVVAGGSNKHEAIASAIRGGFVKTLITDYETALWLIDEAEVDVDTKLKIPISDKKNGNLSINELA